jgi:hypothetical protein
MRFAAFAAALLLCPVSFAVAHAESRVFVIVNQADGYGVDRCLAMGQSCGTQVALAYCKSRDFNQVVAFQKVDASDVTGSLPAQAGKACPSGACTDLVAITCER